MLGYLVGKIVMFALTTLLGVIAIVIPGIMIVDDLVLDARAWLLLALIFVVGMVSTVPIGVALGSLMKSSVQAMLVPLALDADHDRIGHLLSDHHPADVAAVGGAGLPVLLGGARRTLRDAPRGDGRGRDRPVVAHASRCSPCSACGQ